MNTMMTAQRGNIVRQRRTAAEVRRKRVQRARNFLIISALVTLVAFAGHCLPGDDGADADQPTSSIVVDRLLQ